MYFILYLLSLLRIHSLSCFKAFFFVLATYTFYSPMVAPQHPRLFFSSTGAKASLCEFKLCVTIVVLVFEVFSINVEC